MAQLSFFDFENRIATKKTRKAEFLETLNKFVPWQPLIERIAPYYPKVPVWVRWERTAQKAH